MELWTSFTVNKQEATLANHIWHQKQPQSNVSLKPKSVTKKVNEASKLVSEQWDQNICYLSSLSNQPQPAERRNLLAKDCWTGGWRKNTWEKLTWLKASNVHPLLILNEKQPSSFLSFTAKWPTYDRVNPFRHTIRSSWSHGNPSWTVSKVSGKKSKQGFIPSWSHCCWHVNNYIVRSYRTVIVVTNTAIRRTSKA